MQETKNQERIVVVGGSSGMGLALTERLLAAGDAVTMVGRSPERLKEARVKLGDPSALQTIAADATDEDDVAQLFRTVGRVDHIVSTAADLTGAYSPLSDMNLANVRRVVDSKVVAALLLAKHGAPHVAEGGSISFTSGVAAYRPTATGSVVAAVNGAMESLVYALAVELAPLRVNAISPGWVDTPFWDSMAGERKPAVLDGMAKRLPVGKIGAATDLAQAFESIMRNGFITGTVVHVDGGHRLI